MRGVDLLSASRALADEERGEHAEGEHGGPHLVGDAAGSVDGRIVGLAAGEHQARAGEPEVVEGRRPAVRSFRPVAGCARVDEAWVPGSQCRRVETEPGGHALAEVLHEDVGVLRQALHDLDAGGLLQVDGQTLLVPVVGLEVEVRSPGEIEAGRPQHAAPRVAADALLDLDHLGPEVAEHRRGDRSLLPDRPVEDANPFQRHRHGQLLPAAPDTASGFPARGGPGRRAGVVSSDAPVSERPDLATFVSGRPRPVLGERRRHGVRPDGDRHGARGAEPAQVEAV